ncbi:M23 family metallopeptidase [Desulfofundulus thermocisternus]|jgi:murein DD-endopeptidase MepM/ murein hydrolase activator NlpD|uniref:M23 family metallopeptidase n=1 Tax=Desulfofundulus thermocisternus TaxID=42471 RepID=UPI0004891B0C|nr:M23 family metallopeptidase [Desulfofundulus thermocisternus]
MWPFGKRLSEQDPVKKFRHWLRRWLLGSRLHYAVISTVVIALVMVLLWAIISSWQPASSIPVPAPDRDRGVQVLHSSSLDAAQPADEKAPGGNSGRLIIYPPVDGPIVQAYGRGYSEIYGDFRFNRTVAFDAGAGALVKAAAAGTVRAVQSGASLGKAGENGRILPDRPVPVSYTVVIDHGNGWQTIYKGLGEVQVKAGQHLSARAPLGTLPPSAGKLEFGLLKDGAARDPERYLVENIHW